MPLITLFCLLFFYLAETYHVHYYAREQDDRHDNEYRRNGGKRRGGARTGSYNRNGVAQFRAVADRVGNGVNNLVIAALVKLDFRIVVLLVLIGSVRAADGRLGNLFLGRVVKLFGDGYAAFALLAVREFERAELERCARGLSALRAALVLDRKSVV